MYKRPSESGAGGFTLVEILVAAALLAVSIFAVVAVVTKSRELDITDKHRRRARALITAEFESDEYNARYNYNNMTTGTTSDSVLIDERDTGPADDLMGVLQVTVDPEQTRAASQGNDPTYRTVTMVAYWPEPEGNDTVTISKDLSKYR